jgi:hypothetical protein
MPTNAQALVGGCEFDAFKVIERPAARPPAAVVPCERQLIAADVF